MRLAGMVRCGGRGTVLTVRSAPLLLLFFLSWPALLWSHTHLRSSAPADGAELVELPRELRFTFSEAVTLALTHIELRGPDGSVVALLAPVQVADSPQVVVARIAGGLAAGEYQVSWRTTGGDGHPVRGQFGFVIAAEALAVVHPERAAVTHDGTTAADAAAFGVGSPLYVLVRLLGFVGVLGVVGVTAFRLVIVPRVERTERRAGQLLLESIGVAPARLGFVLAALLGLAVVLRLIAQGYALGEGSFDSGGLRAMLVGTIWGWGWVLQAVAVVVAGLGFMWASRGRAGGWAAAGAGALLLVFTLGFAGHAAGVPSGISVALLADAGHVLGAGGWLGGLLLVLGIGLPAALRLEEGVRGEAVAALVRSFSALALSCATLVLVTGVIGAWLHLGNLAALWESGYGRALLIKLGVVALVVGAGAYNYLRVRPLAGSAGGAQRLRRTSTVELAIAAVVLVVTSILVALPTPRG